MGKRIATEEFIERSKKIHGDLYDYSKVSYKNSKTKVCIKCIKCGHEWLSLAENHFRGSGCKKCQYKILPQNQPMSHDVFLNKSYKVHGDKFDFISKYKSFK
ncbi:MAG: zinc-ribbon domain-containing protein, partial [bacterium]